MRPGRLAVLLALAVFALGSLTGCGDDGEKTINLGNGVKMELVRIPAGEFTMGSPQKEKGRGVDEGPQHLVRITKAFYIGKFEVTQEQWREVMGPGSLSCYFEGAENPVEMVSWDDCAEFVKKLNASGKAKGTFSLPTEAEWEYACRAGSTTQYHFGDDEESLNDYAWYGMGKADRRTHPVGEKEPNAFGLYDTHGNVWEWCADWYGKDYYKKSPENDPPGPTTGKDRVLRGGSWGNIPGAGRSASRYSRAPTFRSKYYGFRVVLRDSE